MYDESNWPRASQLENDRIHVCHVIRHQQKTRLRQIFEAKRFYAVNGPGDKVSE
jgi:hypothetical protein